MQNISILYPSLLKFIYFWCAKWFIFKTCTVLNKLVHFYSDRICEVKTMAEERHLMMISWSGEIKLSTSPDIAISPLSPISSHKFTWLISMLFLNPFIPKSHQSKTWTEKMNSTRWKCLQRGSIWMVTLQHFDHRQSKVRSTFQDSIFFSQGG